MVEKQCLCGQDADLASCLYCGKYVCKDHRTDSHDENKKVCAPCDLLFGIINYRYNACACGKDTDIACFSCGKPICEIHQYETINEKTKICGPCNVLNGIMNQRYMCICGRDADIECAYCGITICKDHSGEYVTISEIEGEEKEERDIVCVRCYGSASLNHQILHVVDHLAEIDKSLAKADE